MSACLVLLRHAQASFDHDEYDRLSPLGERQAAALAEGWPACWAPPQRCLSGDQRRQRDTAAPLLRRWSGLRLQVDPRLREFDHREIFYRAHPTLRDPAALAAWKALPGDYQARFEAAWTAALARWRDPAWRADYAEPWTAFQARCLSAVGTHLAALAEGESALLVTSSGVIAAVLDACWGAEGAAFVGLQGALFNAGGSELWREPGAGALGRPGQVNACPHLESVLRTRR